MRLLLHIDLGHGCFTPVSCALSMCNKGAVYAMGVDRGQRLSHDLVVKATKS
jgi:hypothetical protein